MEFNVEISYKELCAMLGEETKTGGTQREKQLKRFSKKVEIKKVGRGKYIILNNNPTHENADNKKFINMVNDFCKRRHIKIVEGLDVNSKMRSKLKYKCEFHKDKIIETTYHNLLRGIGCSYCTYPMSRTEVMLYLGINGSLHRTKIDNIEYDIYLPEKKLAVEYNGILYHDMNTTEEQNRRKLKQEIAEKNEIKLININETAEKEIVFVNDSELIVPTYDTADKELKEKIIKTIQQYLPYEHSSTLWDKAADYMREWKYKKYLENSTNTPQRNKTIFKRRNFN